MNKGAKTLPLVRKVESSDMVNGDKRGGGDGLRIINKSRLTRL